uniref:WD repeat-containing protein on Y chromosome-like n=1 Tax=Fundulus heteroclitus TaxID=8078 RepID=A0A3Q2PCS4_FUNHE
SNEQIRSLFKKIDYSDQGRISWHKAKEETVRRTKKVAFNLPATMSECGHGVPIVNIHSLHDGTVLTVREDGFVCEWSPKLDPQRTKLMFSEGTANRRSKWVTDFALMSEYKKLMIGTDGEIQFYELSTLKPYCQISGLETIPLTLDYLWNRLPKDENVPNIAIKNAVLSPNVTFVRWKVHHDWVTQVKYFHSFHAVASSSNEESSSLVVQTIFSVHKGVKAFDLCQKHCLLVTGGMDRLIRKPNGILKGHSAPIFSLCISSEDSRIFSVSTDGTVKIWHIQDQSCLFTADPKASGIHGDVSACSYSPAMRSLYVAADCVAVLPLMLPRRHSRITVSHDEAVMCCGYSEELRQVVSCSEGSVVKVWDFETGRHIFEFNATPDLNTITCMTFDIKGRLVTGGSNGCLKVWNFNSGQCLKTLKKGKCQQVCDCIIFRVQGDYVAAVGRDRRIDIYPRPQPSWKDDLKSGHKEDILCVVQCPPSLLATGSYNGEIIVWNAASGSINSKFQQKITKLSMTDEKMLLYAADRIGYIYVYNMETFDQEQRSPREHFWRAHTSSITMEIVTTDQVVLTSSTDHTVRLWSSQGELIGTFGQPEKWNVQLPSSWIHPGVPYEFLIEPLSMPHYDILTRKSHLSATISS